MRRAIAVLAVSALALSVTSSVVGAAPKPKPKKVHETFGASLAPFPKLAAWGDPVGLTQPGCYAGQQDVHWVAQEFKSPGKGTLKIWMEGFTGDHDLYVIADDVVMVRSENAQIPIGGIEPAPAEEEILMPLKKNQTITMVACNWLGETDVLAHYEGTFR